MTRYFIEPIGPFRYDSKGVVYPFSNPCKFSSILKKYNIKTHSWATNPRFGFKVLCFVADTLPDEIKKDLPYGLKVSERKWDVKS